MKAGAQAIYRAESRTQAVAAFRRFRARWGRSMAVWSGAWSKTCRNCSLSRLSQTPVAQTAHHQRERALLRRSPPPDSSHGVLCQRRKRESHHRLNSRDSTRNGKPAPSKVLHKPLDVTRSKHDLTRCRSCGTMGTGCGTTGSTNTIGCGNNTSFLCCAGCSNSKSAGGVSSPRILRLTSQLVFSSLAGATPDSLQFIGGQ